MDDLVFVTGNMDKVHWVEKFLGFRLDHHKLEFDEIQDLDLKKVAERKARDAYVILQKPVLVEDAALTFHTMGRLPGTLLKFFLEELGNEGMCRALDAFEDRGATQTVMFGLFDGHEFKEFSASIGGTIAQSPRGTFGFGYDPIFIPDGADKTRGEMDEATYSKYQARKKAVEKLAEHLKGRA